MRVILSKAALKVKSLEELQALKHAIDEEIDAIAVAFQGREMQSFRGPYTFDPDIQHPGEQKESPDYDPEAGDYK